jgi:hypothetical protein
VTEFDTGDVRRVLGFTPSTMHRRVKILRARGWITTRVVVGGRGGTRSVIHFDGHLEELAYRLALASPRTRRRSSTARLTGPPCPRCGRQTLGGARRFGWCGACRWGWPL